MNKYEHCFICNNSMCVVICLKNFQVLLLICSYYFNDFLMIDPICHAFQHNSMVPHGNKKIYEAKIGGGRNRSMQIQVKIKYLVYKIQKPTLFNQIKLTSRCETHCQIFILHKCVLFT